MFVGSRLAGRLSYLVFTSDRRPAGPHRTRVGPYYRLSSDPRTAAAWGIVREIREPQAAVSAASVSDPPGSPDPGPETQLRVLVDLARGGGRDAAGPLLREALRQVTPYCQRRAGEFHGVSVEHVLQEVGIAVLDALPRLGAGGRAIRPHLFVIARNEVLDAQRRSGRRPDPLDDVTREHADPSPCPEEPPLLGDRPSRAHALLARLGDREREVLTLRLLGELTVAETAEAMGMAESAVRLTQHRALGTLRAMVATLPRR